jgi:hypothetical protein
MKTRLSCAATVLLCLTASGCRTTSHDERRPAAATTRPHIAHVVVAWLKRPGDAGDRQKLIDAAPRLRQIPGVVDVYAGPPIPSDRPVVDSSYDVGIILFFADENALAEYVNHPIHQEVLREVTKPLVERYRVYDVAVSR